MNNPEFHDVVFEMHGKQIYAHKVILAARSQYFAAMFSSEMVEAKQNILSITDDISVEVFLLVVSTEFYCHRFHLWAITYRNFVRLSLSTPIRFQTL